MNCFHVVMISNFYVFIYHLPVLFPRRELVESRNTLFRKFRFIHELTTAIWLLNLEYSKRWRFETYLLRAKIRVLNCYDLFVKPFTTWFNK